MSSALERGLRILEMLAAHPEGQQVSQVADALGIPISGVHRQLQELGRLGYVRQVRDQGDYGLTVKLAALGLSFLGRSGVTDIAQPILDRLATASGELIRLSVIDGDRLVWVAVAQGATGGLRYDPGKEQGVVVHLATAAGGQAWLSTMSDEDALTLVSRQGIRPEGFNPGSGAPSTLKDLLKILETARKRGYALAVDSYMEGMAAMAVPLRRGDSDTVIGCLSIAGPAVRLTKTRVAELVPVLKEAATELSNAADASQFFRQLGNDLP
ncbi:IclR family transcriptional regulator [Hwanghaeella grinnelliae]|uniref:IclR family transcriptional regulator n=1 Tax=Hwanghaeella grinnelliae TaxID=2500179 RepID=A0A437QYM5_9PROT|nr:IclR family transcriptional regulator [Hwanghaeella grinnelliae]RVU39599.1 IclR family transcriptional regulator [Hwanghaeella grinnelliae]